MNSPLEIKNLAWQRLKEAEILCDNKMYDGAFYLAGYSVELMLKAKICENFGVPNIFDEKLNNSEQGMGEIRKTLKTHNLYHLIIFSGLKSKYEIQNSDREDFLEGCSLLISSWNENARYKPCGHTNDADVIKLIDFLKQEEGLLKWIEKN